MSTPTPQSLQPAEGERRSTVDNAESSKLFARFNALYDRARWIAAINGAQQEYLETASVEQQLDTAAYLAQAAEHLAFELAAAIDKLKDECEAAIELEDASDGREGSAS